MIKTLLKNLHFLCKNPINDYSRNLTYNMLLRAEEMVEFGELSAKDRIPHILDYSETIDALIKEPKSFCRIGDGEINLINGPNISFQKYDKRLAEYLKRIVAHDVTNCYVGINYNYFHSTKNLSDYNRAFYLLDISEHRKYLLNNCSYNDTYIAAGFNQVYMVFDEFDYETHYKKIMKMLHDKDIVLFCGENVFANITYNIFDYAKSIDYIKCKSMDAFDDFDELLDKCKSIPKERVIAFILGPTSKALVYELSKRGYIAWDIGHLAKDYDYYKKNVPRNSDRVSEFFAPE